MNPTVKCLKRCLPAALLLFSGCQVKTTTPEAQKQPAQASAPATGMDIHALSMTEGKGVDFSLISHRGQVLVLDFWATWSEPCRAGLPVLNKLAREWSGQNVAVVGMVVDRGDPAEIRDAVKSFEISYPVAWGDENVQAAFGGIRALPTKVLVDKKGQIRKQLPGAVAEATLRDEVNLLIAEN